MFWGCDGFASYSVTKIFFKYCIKNDNMKYQFKLSFKYSIFENKNGARWIDIVSSLWNLSGFILNDSTRKHLHCSPKRDSHFIILRLKYVKLFYLGVISFIVHPEQEKGVTLGILRRTMLIVSLKKQKKKK